MHRRGRLVHLLALTCACNGRTVPEQTAGDTTTPTTSSGTGEPPATTEPEAPTSSSSGAPTTGEPPAPVTCGNGIVEPGEVCLGTPVRLEVTATAGVSTVDVDGDGRGDLLTSTGLWLQRDDGFEPGPVPPLVAGGGAGDFDGDGRVDLFAYDDEARTLALSRGDGLGGFAEPTVTVVSKLKGAFAVDVDGDGRSDILGQAPELDALRSYAAGDDGLFTPLAIQPMSIWAGLGGVGDLDGDGFPEVLVGELDTARVWWGQGDGSFEASEESLPAQMFFVPADLEGDGADELLFSFADVRFDDGFYSAGALWPIGPQAEWPRAEVELANYAIRQIAGDLSHDGLGDVILVRLASPNDPVLEVLCSAPGRQLGRCASVQLTTPAQDLAALDIDGDGALDVVFAAGDGNLWAVSATP